MMFLNASDIAALIIIPFTKLDNGQASLFPIEDRVIILITPGTRKPNNHNRNIKLITHSISVQENINKN